MSYSKLTESTELHAYIRLCSVFIRIFHGSNASNFFSLFTESDKYHEMSAAVAEPPKDGFRLDDDSEFPPV